MKKPSTPRLPRRTTAEYRWTKEKMIAFLRALATTGKVRAAARSVEMSAQSAYNLRARMLRDHGPAFDRLWTEALAIALSRQVEETLARMRADRAAKAAARAQMRTATSSQAPRPPREAERNGGRGAPSLPFLQDPRTP